MSVDGRPVGGHAPEDGRVAVGDDELVAIAREGFGAFTRRDIDALLPLTAEDVELVTFRAALEGQSYTGHEGVRRWLEELSEDWEDWRIEEATFRRAGDLVVTLGRVRGRSRGTAVQVEMPAGFVTEFEDGKIRRLTSYGDPAEAVRAAGLKP